LWLVCSTNSVSVKKATKWSLLRGEKLKYSLSCTHPCGELKIDEELNYFPPPSQLKNHTLI
jgi:hypothetical protein